MGKSFQQQKLILFAVFFTTLFFVSVYAHPQDVKVVRDLGLWTEIKVEKEVKDFTFSLSQHIRFHENITGFDDYISEIGLDYKINKNFDIGAAGRYTRNKHFDDIAENDYRYDFYLSYDTDIHDKLNLQGRVKYQKKFYNSAVFNEFLNYYETAFRYRIRIRWEKNDSHRFYSAAEIFRLTKKSRAPFWNKFRIWAGDDISSGLGDFDLALGVDRELKSTNPYTYFILKVAYKIEL